MKKLLVWLCAASLAIVPTSAFSATYWLDDDGVDTTSCDTAVACGASACRYWKYLVKSSGATIASGDIINLCPTEGADVIYGSADATECGIDVYGITNLTFQGSTGTRADVRVTGGSNTTSCRAYSSGGSDPDATFRFDGSASFGTVKDLTIIAATPIDASKPSGVLIRNSDDVTVNNVVIESSEFGGVTCGANGAGGGAESLRVTVTGSTITSPCLGGGGCAGILAYRCPLSDFNTTTVTNGTAPTTGDRDGVHIANSHGSIVDGLTVTGFSEEGIDLSRTGSSDPVCESWNAGGCVGGSEVGTACAVSADCAGGGACQQFRVEGNLVYGNAVSGTGSALALKSCAYNVLVQNNMLKQLGGDAIRLNKCAHGLDIYNNTLLGSLQVWQNHYSLDVRNNIMVADGQVMQVSNTSMNLEASDETTFDYNVVYRRTGSEVISGLIGGSATLPLETQQCGGPGDVGPGTICCDIQAGGTASSYTNAQGALFASDNEFGLVGANNIFNTDVAFVNDAGSPPNLHLATGDVSGAKQGGVTIAVVGTDFDGTARPQDAAYEIGADEISGAGGTTTTTTLPATTTTTTSTTTTTLSPAAATGTFSLSLP